MKKYVKIALIIFALIATIVAAVLFVKTNNIAVLEPKGIIAQKEKDLLIITSLLMLIVVIPAILFTLIFAWVYRADNKGATYRPDWSESHVAEVFWWGVPSVIIIFLAILTYQSSHALDPYKPIESDKKPITIQAIALEWKWLFIYPEQGIATVNYIEFPVDTPLNFEITADAPMNSFWIPQLGGQIYAMPAMKSKLHLMATEVGSYRGSSSNISGVGFAGMVFTAKATSEEEFENWVEEVQNSPLSLTLEEYNELMKPSEYNKVTLYALEKDDLFDYIIMKYGAP